jgi:hypothetical protein
MDKFSLLLARFLYRDFVLFLGGVMVIVAFSFGTNIRAVYTTIGKTGYSWHKFTFHGFSQKHPSSTSRRA